MKKYAIYMTNELKELARDAKDILEGFIPDAKVSYFVEDNNIQNRESFCDLPILSLDKVKQLCDEKKIVGIVIPSSYHPVRLYEHIISLCRQAELKRESIFTMPINALRAPEANADENSLVLLDDLIQIRDVLWNIQHDCNLNCRSCVVASNISPRKGPYDFEMFKQEVERLHMLVPNVYNISILGGEPFLNPRISEYVEYARDIYPYSLITVSTNGILLFSTPSSILQRIRDANAKIHLSLYPPFYDRLDDMTAILKESGVGFFVTPIRKFSKFLTKAPQYSRLEGAKKCTYRCTGIRDKRISRCEVALYVENINKKFGITLPEYKGIDFFDESMTGRKLMRMLQEPLDLCQYCTRGRRVEMLDWKRSENDDLLEDFFVESI